MLMDKTYQAHSMAIPIKAKMEYSSHEKGVASSYADPASVPESSSVRGSYSSAAFAGAKNAMMRSIIAFASVSGAVDLFRGLHEDVVEAWSSCIGTLRPRRGGRGGEVRVNCAPSSVEGYDALLPAACHGEGKEGDGDVGSRKAAHKPTEASEKRGMASRDEQWRPLLSIRSWRSKLRAQTN
jgi:hypothetical protein